MAAATERVDRRDFLKSVVDDIVGQLEAGVSPWSKPWTDDARAFPYNAFTEKAYSGLNIIILMMAQRRGGFRSSGWMTFNQKEEINARIGDKAVKIKAGAKAATVVRWVDWIPASYRRNSDGSFYDPKTDTLMTKAQATKWKPRAFSVFNVDQLEGLPERYLPKPGRVWTAEEQRHDFMHLVQATGADVLYGGNEACHLIGTNTVHMPHFDQFESEQHFYATLGHELIHWTGSPLRCDRDQSGFKSDPKGYALEELVAEIGSAFLCAHFGIKGDLRHASYIKHWVGMLKADPMALLKAARLAEDAFHTLLKCVEHFDAQPASVQAA